MTHSSTSPNGRSRGRWALIAALGASLLLLPGASAPAVAGGGHGHHHGHKHGHHHGYHRHGGPVIVAQPYAVPYYAPVRVRYYRPYVAPAYYTLSSPYVLMHGPAVAASVVYYPASAPVVYEAGYCPRAVHYHPYAARPGVHGSVSIGFGF